MDPKDLTCTGFIKEICIDPQKLILQKFNSREIFTLEYFLYNIQNSGKV